MKLLHRHFLIISIFLINSFVAFSQINTPYLKLISPNRGERWEAKTTQTITWQSRNITSIKIEYSLNAGINWYTITPSVDASEEKYSWTTPNVQVAEVLIKISDVSNPTISDVSDTQFSIIINSSIMKSRSKQNTAQLNNPPLKIMPLGDSITEGGGDDTNQVGYRSKLFDLLQQGGYNFDFVGSQHSGSSYTSNPEFDADHEGHSGMEVGHPSYLNASTMLDNIDNYLNQNTPDIVLLHLGTNDLDDGNDPQQVANQLDTLIVDHILAHNPNTYIFWARLIYNQHVNVAIVNYDIGTNYTSLTPQQKARVKLVYMDLSPKLIYPDDFSQPQPDHLFEDVHPVRSGYDKMAEHWFAAMQAYFQPVLSSPSNGATNQSINITLKWTAPPVSSDYSVAYQIQVAADSAFKNIVYEDSSISSTSVNLTGLNYSAKYYWRVRVKNYGWSSKGVFSTGPFSVFVKVFLQGPYAGNDSMRTTLRQNNEIPSTQPYNNAPWNYSGKEKVSSFPAGIVDWVLIELHGVNNDTVVAKRAALLKNDGIIIDTGYVIGDYVNFNRVSPGDYYIVVRHRNHIDIMSAKPVHLPDSTIYDFTSAQAQAYGNKAMSDLGDGNFGLTAGDNNNDGVISINDYNGISDNISKTGYFIFDDNMDGIISSSDYNSVSGNLFKYSKVP